MKQLLLLCCSTLLCTADFMVCSGRENAFPMKDLQEKLKKSSYAEKIYSNAKNPKALRRRAFSGLLKSSKEFEKTVLRGLKDPDAMIRRHALASYLEKRGQNGETILKSLASDKDPVMAQYVLWCTKRIKSSELKMAVLKLMASKNPLPEIRKEAKRLVSFNFYRKNIRLQDDPTWDHDVAVIQKIPLPEHHWSFRLDPWEDGHKKGYFKVDFDDRAWNKISIGKSWEKQGYRGYDGFAYYRIRFKAPPKGEANAAELFFEAVDEGAWVWVNGQYVGQHDIGKSGWNKPFYLDISKEILWGKENLLTVRVEDTLASGGIWKKVFLHILK